MAKQKNRIKIQCNYQYNFQKINNKKYFNMNNIKYRYYLKIYKFTCKIIKYLSI